MSRTPHGWRSALSRPPGRVAAAVALVYWWGSLQPTLMPRSGIVQGVLSGLAVSVGYALGTGATWVVGALVRRIRAASAATVSSSAVSVARRRAALVIGTAWAVAAGAGSWRWMMWQNDQRGLVGGEDVGVLDALTSLAVTAAVVVVLGVVARLVAHGLRRLDAAMNRYGSPPWAGRIAIVIVVAVVAVGGSRQIVIDPAIAWLDRSYGSFDLAGSDPGIVQPTRPERSGSPASLVAWDTLGAEGRDFTGGGPTRAELAAFAPPGATVREPVRLYAGLRTADTPEGRAALVVRELERTGAADRAVVAIWTVTGTGFVDPAAASTLEYMHRGDTAIVAQQYSYLPSWVSFLIDTDSAADAGRALTDAVRSWWRGLPSTGRPKLVSFGLSLGSFGSEAAIVGDDLETSLRAAEEFSGVLWAGPTNGNAVWQQVVEARDPASPVWRPTLSGRVRFLGPADAPPPAATTPTAGPGAGTRPAIVYLAHPSDPVTWWNWSTLWWPPAWMDRPRGEDVPRGGFWLPGVTFVQVVADLMNGFGASSGHGHNYNRDIVAGWSAVVPPPGWTTEDARRLQDLLGLDTRPAA